jgi:hypothetical protein
MPKRGLAYEIIELRSPTAKPNVEKKDVHTVGPLCWSRISWWWGAAALVEGREGVHSLFMVRSPDSSGRLKVERVLKIQLLRVSRQLYHIICMGRVAILPCCKQELCLLYSLRFRKVGTVFHMA